MSPAPSSLRRSTDTLTLLGLLWTPSQVVGRSGITLGTITEGAVALADSDGLDAVTMRRVAAEVGVGAMTLYTYVPGRAELLELMVDHVARTVYSDSPAPASSEGWIAGVRRIAEGNWSHHLRHPWTLDIPPGRPVLGPGVSLKYEAELGPLDGIGLSDVEMDDLLTALLGLVESAARIHVGLERVRRDSAMTDEQWWTIAAPLLDSAMSGVELPLASRVGAAVASAGRPYDSLQFALDRLVGGLAARLGDAA